MANTITNVDAGNFQTDGVYIDQIPTPSPSPQGAASDRIGIVGCANYGPVNTPVAFSDISSLAYAFGNNSTLPNSILDAQVCMPECNDFVGVRPADGTQTAATILVLDTTSATLVTLVNLFTGQLPNQAANGGVGAYAFTSLVASSASGSPQYQTQIVFPGYTTESYTVNAFATVGGGYSAPTFIANLVAAVNGLNPNQAGSPRWSATTGTGTAAPAATNQLASGGTNGTTTITTAVLLGTNGNSATGMYALGGQISTGSFFIAGLSDPSAAATMAAFAVIENAVAIAGFPSLTATTTAQTNIGQYNMVNDSLILAMDWDQFYDAFAGVNRLFAAQAKVAGIIASLPSFQYPGNQPPGGAVGIIATDRASNPVKLAEARLRQQSNLLYLTNNPNLFNRATGYGLPFGTTSSGKLISDVRMLKTISFQLGLAFGPLVGSMQGPLVTNGAETDPFRIALADAADAVLQPYVQAKQIVGYTLINNSSNNSNTQIDEGFAFIQVAVETKAAARFIVTFLQVGDTVQYQTAA